MKLKYLILQFSACQPMARGPHRPFGVYEYIEDYLSYWGPSGPFKPFRCITNMFVLCGASYWRRASIPRGFGLVPRGFASVPR